MLQAIDQKGDYIILALLPSTEVQRYKQEKYFYCPMCKAPVIVKAGSKTIAHFAHHKKSLCPNSSGGEGEYHERGKLHLYQWLKGQGLAVWLEWYISHIKQRPDILLKVGKKVIAIEYQCARITMNEFIQRNKGYHQMNITPIWILGGNRMTRKSSSYLSMSSSDLLFLHQFSSDLPLTIYYYCPDNLQFACFHHIQTTGTKRTIGELVFRSLHDMNFNDLFRKYYFNKINIYENWKKQMYERRIKPVHYIGRKEKQWRQWLYVQKINANLIPSICHLPIATQWRMMTAPWIWQSRLLISLFQDKKYVTLQSCHHILSNHMHNKSLFPLIHGPNDPVSEYLTLLVKLHTLKQISDTRYYVSKQITFPKTVDMAIDEDNQLIKQMLSPSFLTHD
ncbi:competence protein CoiA [Aquibacillus rhizosphaerae]|uniref:Competence protein CoiA family protein n=1 Tax=Aquibacillus rhizosphaerae TaxID=3051431 RepID=A0ABT7LEH2_9BACI|nr:competence protein CoiA family protein [Aquibacillus sp. LR5S19]MDL4842931.1 competence protein CoiA family protein [Aquibacillus sp. LR5S19]